MKPDPVRWRDGAADAPQDARAWLEGLRPPGPMPSASRARAAAVASSAVGAKAGAAWWSAKALLAVGALGVAALSARAVFVAPVRAGSDAPRTVATMPSGRAIAIAAPTPVVAPATPQRPAPVLIPPANSPAAVPHRAHTVVAPVTASIAPIAATPLPANDAPTVATAPTESALAREVRQVDALRALVASDPAAALAAADAMAREFPDGTTAPDREFYAFEALRRLGRSDEARTRGERLVARFAGTPGAVRVARALARDE